MSVIVQSIETLHLIKIQDDIRLRAYYFWENAGKPDGRDLEFWSKAQHEWWLELMALGL